MSHCAPLPTAFATRSFTVREALAAAVSPSRLRAGDLFRPFRGVRVRRSAIPTTHKAAARAYAARLQPGQFFSHATAAALWGLPLPRRIESRRQVHVTTPGRNLAVRMHGVVGHRAQAPRPPVQHCGLPVADPVSTWVVLSRTLTVRELIVLGDAIVCPAYAADGSVRPALATREHLAEAVRRHRRRPGVRRLRAAAERIREGAQSPPETSLRLLLVDHGLDEPELNQTITTRSGRFVARVDALYRSSRVVIEYEGDHHRTQMSTFRNDIRRREAIEDEGWRVVRVSADDLTVHASALVDRVRRLCGSRAEFGAFRMHESSSTVR